MATKVGSHHQKVIRVVRVETQTQVVQVVVVVGQMLQAQVLMPGTVHLLLLQV